MRLVVEKGRLHRRHVQLLFLRRPPGQEGIPADQEPIIYDHVDAVLLRHQFGAKALAGAAFPDERINPNASNEP